MSIFFQRFEPRGLNNYAANLLILIWANKVHSSAYVCL